jgi:uncharacterized protein YqfA (UPF0365 family)
MGEVTTTEKNGAAGRHGALDGVSHALQECRTRVDELLVQIDLAKLDVREEVDTKLETAQNAYLAAKSKLTDAREDASATVAALREAVEEMLHDLGRACAEVDAAVKRGS